jgi:chromate transporter
LAEATRFWLKLGFISFGGPAGQIAIMHRELVEERGWIVESRFLHALNFCMFLPGPEAAQLAIYIGWLLHGTPGGLIAGVLFVLPSVFILWGLSLLYATYASLGWVAAIFYGLKAAVLAIVAHALIRIARRSLKSAVFIALAVASFVALFVFNVPFPFVILGAGLVGLAGGLMRLPAFMPSRDSAEPAVAYSEESRARPSWGRSLRVIGLGLLLWWLPVIGAGLWLGWDNLLVREGVFFSKAAMVTVRGAYAVLPYVAQLAVSKFGWLSASQMLSGLGWPRRRPGRSSWWCCLSGFSPAGSIRLRSLRSAWPPPAPCSRPG